MDEGKEISLGDNYTKKKNILLVVLEGIPGAYFEEIQNSSNFKYNTRLDSFEKIYNNSVVIPNFITHNNQTIRGLYSILSGKYPKLDASTPKATQFSQSKNKEEMLPSVLNGQNYSTVFLQAAPLEFMSKDQFAKDAGFNTILGNKDFEYQYIPFGWGIDDKAFLEQSFKYINDLKSKNKPWFATMLTVGKHHPYAIPEELEQDFPNRKEASIKYLDDSLNCFLDSIDKSGITKDTLVLFTSDESHGVNNHPLGSNWGFLLAYDPEIDGPIINNGIYGQIDIFSSILDYLGFASEMNGNSIFREYEKKRPMIFSSHYDGNIYFLKNENTVYKIESDGSLFQINFKSLFELPYIEEKIENDKLRDEILSYAYALNSELSRTISENNILISKNKKLSIKNSEKLLITSGQYITLPKDSVVTISFEYKIS